MCVTVTVTVTVSILPGIAVADTCVAGVTLNVLEAIYNKSIMTLV